jgi:large subunit ribosomal protein L15
MITLSQLTNTSRPRKKVQRVGRGVGSGRGKTCKRGSKGDKARSGYKQRYGEEGGQKPLYRRMPTRGFSHGRFRKEVREITFDIIETLYQDGEVVNEETLRQKGYLAKADFGAFKVLATGQLQKKVSIEATGFSKKAQEILQNQSIPFKVV